ncbi:predicted protein [Listeria monocytogenes J2818]|nr:predicted protein [Listeria monocytogenes J2818]
MSINLNIRNYFNPRKNDKLKMLKALTKKRGGWIEKSFITNSS